MPDNEQTNENRGPTYAPLLYFFVDASSIPDQFRGRFGLESGFWGRLKGLAGGDHCASRQGNIGPDDKRGMLATPFDAGTSPAEFIQYMPERQEWTEIEDGVYLGIDRDAAPEHFLREEIANPKYLINNDRGSWMIPVALLDAEDCGLPQQDIFKKGQWHSVPRPAYRELADRATHLYQVEQGEENDPGREWLRETAVLAIGCNYALTAAEMAALDLLHTEAYNSIASILTDQPEREKKSEVG